MSATDTSRTEWRCSLELLANDMRGLSLESPLIALHSASPLNHLILQCLCLQLIQLSILPQLPPALSGLVTGERIRCDDSARAATRQRP